MQVNRHEVLPGPQRLIQVRMQVVLIDATIPPLDTAIVLTVLITGCACSGSPIVPLLSVTRYCECGPKSTIRAPTFRPEQIRFGIAPPHRRFAVSFSPPLFQ